MNKIFYAIDMGSPSKSGGFFCWKYSLRDHQLTSFKGAKGWLNCIEEITKDTKKSEVHLTIEAPLWGNRLKTGNKYWKVRFRLKSKEKLIEHPWYTLAGASTGFMAQEFLLELNKSLHNKKRLKNKIILRESYISGLKGDKGVGKPKCLIDTKKGEHANDAFEGLLLTLDANNILKQDYIFTLIKKNELEKWLNVKENKITYLNGKRYEAFPFGPLKEQEYFDFKCGKILFTKRNLFDRKN